MAGVGKLMSLVAHKRPVPQQNQSLFCPSFKNRRDYSFDLPSPSTSSIKISLVIKIHVSLKLPTLCL